MFHFASNFSTTCHRDPLYMKDVPWDRETEWKTQLAFDSCFGVYCTAWITYSPPCTFLSSLRTVLPTVLCLTVFCVAYCNYSIYSMYCKLFFVAAMATCFASVTAMDPETGQAWNSDEQFRTRVESDFPMYSAEKKDRLIGVLMGSALDHSVTLIHQVYTGLRDGVLLIGEPTLRWRNNFGVDSINSKVVSPSQSWFTDK